MKIAIGIPNAVPGATGASLLEWARRADRAGFSSLGSIGALSYPSYEELTLFAAAGAVTERIRFLSNVLIAPVRTAAEIAKQAATVDQLTGGRLSLGLGVGWRTGDFVLAGRDYHRRGELMDALLADLRTALAGGAIADGTAPPAPAPVQSPIPLIIGGTTDAAIRRVVEYGTGWTAGGMPADAVAEFSGKVRAAWAEAGREGQPQIVALRYFGLGDTEQESRRNIVDYYTPMGAETAEYIAGSVFRTPEAIREALAQYEEAGVDELFIDPSVADPAQVDLLAEVVFS